MHSLKSVDEKETPHPYKINWSLTVSLKNILISVLLQLKDGKLLYQAAHLIVNFCLLSGNDWATRTEAGTEAGPVSCTSGVNWAAFTSLTSYAAAVIPRAFIKCFARYIKENQKAIATPMSSVNCYVRTSNPKSMYNLTGLRNFTIGNTEKH